MRRINWIMLSFVCGMFVTNSLIWANTRQEQVVHVSLTNFGIRLNTPVHAGKVTLVIANEANDVIHEIQIVKTDLPVDRLPVEPTGLVDENSIRLMPITSVEDVGPRRTRTATIELKPGRYVYFCNQPHHYSLGMRGEIYVQS